MMITAERLRELLAYDPGTGIFTWLPRIASTSLERTWNTRWVGKRAGTPHSKGYVLIRIDDRGYLAHRLAWLWVHGAWPSSDLDHANGSASDNRILNLRIATPTQNCRNSRRYSNNKSGFKGVLWSQQRHRWQARIVVAGKQCHLGSFDTPEEAHAAYAAASTKHFGEFARVA